MADNSTDGEMENGNQRRQTHQQPQRVTAITEETRNAERPRNDNNGTVASQARVLNASRNANVPVAEIDYDDMPALEAMEDIDFFIAGEASAVDDIANAQVTIFPSGHLSQADKFAQRNTVPADNDTLAPTQS
ncbi:hypothetical protein Hypma_006893 [Hypsizygus marmoreus]|uniref:Uncharacterized protein n=1 Tax=Hypsizygus marmoreus TaxID=39966 RepID=A0A369JZB3_HYPMA|nr:hypothetical protein Hypma_006893 [Hypsizygus marmoreus]